MNDLAPNGLLGNKGRLLIDKLTKYIVTSGGLAVLMTLLLIVIYLMWIIFPLFKSPIANYLIDVPFSKTENTLSMGLIDQNHLIYRYTESGKFQLFSIYPNQKWLLDKSLVSERITSFSSQNSQTNFSAFGLANGKVQLQKLNVFKDDNQSLVQLEPTSAIYSVLDIVNKPIEELSFNVDEQLITLLAATRNEVYFGKWEHDKRVLFQPIYMEGSAKVQLEKNGNEFYILSEDFLFKYQVNEQKIQQKEKIDIFQMTGQLAEDISIIDENTLLISLKNGEKTLWFETLIDGKRRLTLQWRNNTKNLITAYDAQSNTLVYLDKNKLTLLNLLNNSKQQIILENFSGIAERIVFSSSDHLLLIEQRERLSLYKIINPHFEINFSSLWKKTLYPNEEKAEYIWQSNLVNTEAKYSLVPLIFGSMKVAVITLLFSAPIAIGGAIYTAYFMSSRLRNLIKPSVELMEALPTVILGVIASFLLAPLIERNLIASLLFFTVTPIFFVLWAVIWGIFPIKWQKKFSPQQHLLFVILIIIVIALGLFKLGDWIEIAYLDGNSSDFVSQLLGIDIMQRNSIVVGIAMGFAIIPTIFTISEDAIYSVPSHLTNGSLALGATTWQTLIFVVLSTASPGIISALMMGCSRAIGETMIVLMVTGNTPIIDWNPFVGLRALTANIALEMPESAVGSSHFRVLFLTAFLLLIFSFIFNTLSELVRQRLSNKYKSL